MTATRTIAQRRDVDAILTGVLLGTAVGDALGLPAENLSPERIRRLWQGQWRIRFICGRGMISDDTEHALMTGKEMMKSRRASLRQNACIIAKALPSATRRYSRLKICATWRCGSVRGHGVLRGMVLPKVVAQNCILLYRRFVICQASLRTDAYGLALASPNAMHRNL
ncbi:MAG TPA: ADP-ribosylglycohydrolase family protein [Verrucomicrobiae bacterium]